MNKKLRNFSILLLLFTIIFSCRNDYLVQSEANNQSELFGLTSKIISLNESAHKSRILLELKLAKQMLSKTSTNAFGKVVNFGDTISINTDHVIYVENGNYHNYIFKLERSNSVVGDPLENLLLSPLPDGSYKEFLILYNITNQELQSFENGTWEIPKNRIKVTELAAGAFNNGQLAKLGGGVDCVWTTVFLGYTTCGASGNGPHSHGEGSDQCNNAADGYGSQAVYGSYWKCTDVPEDTSYAPSDPPSNEGGGSTSNSGSTTNNPTYDCIEVPVNPTDPSTGIGDDGGCEIGLPILPNLGNPKEDTPCNKLKSLLDPLKANLKSYITNDLYNYINDYPDKDGEAGRYLRRNSNGYLSYETAPFSTINALPPKWGLDYYSIIHTHPDKAYPMFSYSDMTVMYKLEVDASTHNNGKSSFLLVCTVNGVKQTYGIVFENTGLLMEQTWAKPEYAGLTIGEKIKALNKKLKDMYIKEGKKNSPDYERVFLQFNFGTNIGLYKANTNLTGWSKLTINSNSDTATVTPTNCN